MTETLRSASPPPQTPGRKLGGWIRVTLPRGGDFLARPGRDGWEVLPAAPRLDKGAAGHPLASLTLVLAHPPAGTDNIEELVTSGSLALTCSFRMSDDEFRGLQALLGGVCRPYFVRSATSRLRGGKKVYRKADFVGAEQKWWLGVSLPAEPAVEALGTFRHKVAPKSPLRVITELHDDGAPIIEDVLLADLLGGLLEGPTPERFLTMVSVSRDGGLAPVPPLRRSAAGATRAGPEAAPMLAMGNTLQALPFAMASGTLANASAAAIAASDTSSVAARINPNVELIIANDALLTVNAPTIIGGGGTQDAPTEHLPLVENLNAPSWNDALDGTVTFYAPGFEPVLPAPSDDPATSAFSFVFAKSGPVVGPSPVLQTGLTGTVRTTVRQVIPGAVTAALANAPGIVPKAVVMQGITCALEISFRRAGSAEIVTQRFPGTVTQQGDRLVAAVDLLDDWVRLAYGGLATGAETGIPAPRLVVDYSFRFYDWVWVADHRNPDRLRARTDFVAVGGGLTDRIPQVETLADLPQQVDGPVLVRETLSVVGGSAVTQFRRERHGVRSRDIKPLALQAAAIGQIRPNLRPEMLPADRVPIERPPIGRPPGRPPIRPPIDRPPVIRQRRLMVRTMVRSESVPLSLPCGSFGNLYLERAANGMLTAVGCQDSLKLGETSTKAFEEISELRDPSFRVWRSLQQPGRFLLTPTSYRVGRYGPEKGEGAYRPMIALFGIIDPDSSKHRYVLAATLIPDIPQTVLARLDERLAAHAPVRAPRSIVYPTDPFVGATTTFAWSVPASTETPQTFTVIDAITVKFEMAITEAMLFMAMVNRTGIQGVASFKLPDGTVMQSGLTIDEEVIGPPETGPVTVAVSSASARLRNVTAERMNVLGVVTVAADGTTRTVSAGATLDPAGEMDVPVDVGTKQALVDARPADRRKIEEMNVFIEDVTTEVTFIRLPVLVNHGLTALRARARLKGESHVEEVDLKDTETGTVSFTLPITTYLERRTLQFSLLKTSASPPSTTETPWRDWDLDKGGFIQITQDML